MLGSLRLQLPHRQLDLESSNCVEIHTWLLTMATKFSVKPLHYCPVFKHVMSRGKHPVISRWCSEQTVYTQTLYNFWIQIMSVDIGFKSAGAAQGNLHENLPPLSGHCSGRLIISPN